MNLGMNKVDLIFYRHYTPILFYLEKGFVGFVLVLVWGGFFSAFWRQ